MNHEFPSEIAHSSKRDLLKSKAENPISDRIVLIVPGFGSNGEAYQSFAEQLNLCGFNTITPTYNIESLNDFRNLFNRYNVDRLKQQVDLEIVKAEGLVDVVAHSKGAYDIIKVAAKHPEYFRNIVLVAPGGLRPIMFPIKGITTLIEGEHKDEIDKARLIAKGDENLAEVTRINRTYGVRYKKDKIRHDLEGITAGTKYIRKLLPKLREEGIKIAIICQKEDSMYPPELFDDFVRNNVNYFIEVSGLHGAIKYTPEVGQLAADLLIKMEADRFSVAT